MQNILPPPGLTKPRLRGLSHLVAAIAAAVAGVFLVTLPQAPHAVWTAAIYAFSLVAMFGVSALYHVPNWSQRARQVLKRLDHAAIFVLIAGTATPVATLALGAEDRTLLSAMWIGAVIGMVQAVFWVHAPRWLTAFIYVGLGWLVVPYLQQMSSALGTTGVGLILGGGVFYTLGALIYASRWPNPAPRTFGYHEIFHLFVIAASICHFTAIWALMQGPLAG